MNDFLLIFRRDFKSPETQPTAEQLKDHLQQWKDWYETLAAEDRLSRPLQRWDADGRVLKSNNSVTNGPYAEIKETIGGLVIIKAESYEDALSVAQGSPILNVGGSVEVRKGF